jgi:acyl-[acyl-carrier-protein]-phospholipid O-acyltransferase/long-chain-fatty-acid--[acyl-carrier-protein] ligase
MNDSTVRRHSIKPLVVAQFFGAFTDNAWKLVVITLGLTLLSQAGDEPPGVLQQQKVATLASIVFLLPMILLSLPAGSLADRLSKRSVVVATKVVERRDGYEGRVTTSALDPGEMCRQRSAQPVHSPCRSVHQGGPVAPAGHGENRPACREQDRPGATGGASRRPADGNLVR